MSDPILLEDVSEGIATLTLNNPRRLNGWTLPMQEALKAAMDRAAQDDSVKVVILTGNGDYYSAGVDLGGSFKLDHPKKLHAIIVEKNQALFDLFITFPKPILAAVNGHAIGAPVTSATLCDAIIAAEQATFSTPFAKVGLPAEGCSSVLFARLLGHKTAERMLGGEGWKPTAEEARSAGLIDVAVPGDTLAEEARKIAEGWIRENRVRTYRGGATQEELLRVNAEESRRVADGFLSPAFLMNQYRFFRSRKKTAPALAFLALRATRPIWGQLLP